MDAIKAPTVTPGRDRFFVVADEPEEVSEAGIVIPKEGQTAKTSGTVVAVGPGKPNCCVGEPAPPSVSVGDRVIWSYSHMSFTYEGVEYIVMTEDMIVAFLPDKREVI
jgi:chaperonin GroES